MKSKLNTYYEDQQQRFLEQWKEFLRFPSISMQPEHEGDCQSCAEWLVRHLSQLGFKAELKKTSSKPVVFATRDGDISAPRVLYYGHYDVQPVDPLELWDSKPFEPTLRDGRLYARGALDNKGQTFYVLKAIEALISLKVALPPLALVIEGEEEAGSEGLSEILGGWQDQLRSDVLLVCDTEALGPGEPAISMGLRGIVHLSVKLGGISHDLHSGVHGGVAPNPALQLARLLATLHDGAGKIAVKGFYDSVQPVSSKLRELALSFPFDAKKYKRETGVEPLGGEQGYSAQERMGLRPTIEINGLNSGYQGAGVKTIIPAHAEAKITSRIVTGQDPAKILDLIKAHLRANAPKGLSLEVPFEGVGGPAISLDANSSLVARATRVLNQLGGKPPVFAWWGASIPIVSKLALTAKAEPLMVGFGLAEDRMHAPNESFALTQFRDGFMFAGLFLGSFAEAR